MEDFTFLDLVKAYFDCRKRKRNTLTALRFELNLEENLLDLYKDLKNGTYEIGKSICFIVRYPKPREVWAADFRDRIVHHLIYNSIRERFYNRFICDTYSCIPERGTHLAAERVAKFARSITHNYNKDAYYMKADIKNFFVSIDKDVLYNELKKYVFEEWILKLLKQVIYHDPKSKVFIKSPKKLFKLLPEYKSLWHTDNSKGLPIGNLTSQFFSNVYLNVLDQYVKHKLHCKYYCRYVDDFVMMSYDPKELNRWHKELTEFLKESLCLELHQNKKEINKIERGIDFVGYMMKPHRTVMRQKTLKRVFKIIREFKKDPYWYTEEKLTDFRNSMNSYIGMMRHIEGYRMRKKICLESINLFIGCDEEFTKLEIN